MITLHLIQEEDPKLSKKIDLLYECPFICQKAPCTLYKHEYIRIDMARVELLAYCHYVYYRSG